MPVLGSGLNVLVTALIDLTLLSTPSRTRGIGRYAADLACAIDRAAPGTIPVAVRAIERFDWTGQAAVAGDLCGAVDRIGRDRRRFSHAQWAYRVRLRLAAVVRQSGADVLHSPHPDATPLGRLGCPRVVTCHDLISMSEPDHYAGWRDGWRWGRRRLDSRRYGSADHIIAVSATTAADLVAMLNVAPSKITIVHHGVDRARFSATPLPGDETVRRRHGLADRRYMLFVGAADWRKNAAGMLAAMKMVRKRAETADVVLAWAGRIDAEDLTAVRTCARESGASDALLLLGYIPDADLAALLRGAIALLFVSRIEGFGYPAIEAMACGCAVIGSDRPATKEMAGDAACLVDPERPDAIADAIVALADNPQERSRFAQSGLNRSRRFSLQRMAEQTADVYRLAGTRARR
jgi:glycosyltransferase involved in cell wall biosynthesis